jgi:hypothetical protein
VWVQALGLLHEPQTTLPFARHTQKEGQRGDMKTMILAYLQDLLKGCPKWLTLNI